MKKLRLETLEITSFSTSQTPMDEPRGTVRGHLTNGAWTCAYHCTWNHATCADTTCQPEEPRLSEQVTCLC